MLGVPGKTGAAQYKVEGCPVGLRDEQIQETLVHGRWSKGLWDGWDDGAPPILKVERGKGTTRIVTTQVDARLGALETYADAVTSWGQTQV